MMLAAGSHAQVGAPQWALQEPKSGQTVPLADVSFLLASDWQDSFSIVCNDGSVIAGAETVNFVKATASGIGSAPAAEQQVFPLPPVEKSGPQPVNTPARRGNQGSHPVKGCGGKQRQQQKIGKFKQKKFLVFVSVRGRRSPASSRYRWRISYIIRQGAAAAQEVPGRRFDKLCGECYAVVASAILFRKNVGTTGRNHS